MTRRIPPLNAMRAFEAAARWLSFTKAADELHVTQGAISRQVKLLEEFLGFDLFERTPHGVELNRSGQAYAAALARAFDEIHRATDELGTARTQTVLTIRGYTTFLVRWLTPLLPDFQVRHPNIEVRLVSASDPVDFDRDKVDLGIRYGYGRWKDLESDLLFTDELFPVCSPTLRDRVPLRAPEDLRECTLLHLNLRRQDWPEWFAVAGVDRPISGPEIYLEDLGVAYQCAIAGFGVAIGQWEYLVDDLATRRLVAPFEPVLRRPTGYYLVCPRARAGLAKIAVFRSWLRETLQQRAAPAGTRHSLNSSG